MFDALAWIERCKTCKNAKVYRTEVRCKLLGTCQFVLKPLEEETVIEKSDEEYECRRCHDFFEASEMSKQTCNGYVYYRYCKKCKSEIHKEYRAKQKNESQDKDFLKVCSVCRSILPITEFVKNEKTGNYYAYCTICANIKNQLKSTKSKKPSEETVFEHTYTCRSCGNTFPTSQMKRVVINSYVYYRRCKECSRKMDALYHRNKFERDKQQGIRKCKSCKRMLPIAEFDVISEKAGRYKFCKDCMKKGGQK